MNRRFLANSKDGKIGAYGIDTDGGIIGLNLDIGYMFANRDYIRTGFQTEREAQEWLKQTRKKQQRKRK